MSRVFLATLLLLVCVPEKLVAQIPNAVVIIYAEFGNEYEIGTGAFVDHDGLILTADHVVHHINLNPFSSYLASNPTTTTPTKITVFVTEPKVRIDVDVNTIIGGNISPTQWIDVAFMRVKLTDIQKAQIIPLDISMDVPNAGAAVAAYGPLCVNFPIDFKCFEPGVQKTDLYNNPRTAREYQVRSNITTGYSGGPLVSDSGKIIAVTSWGDLLQGTNVVVKASFVPAPYILRYFSHREPDSNVFTEAQACTTANNLLSLTFFDWDQISKPWFKTPISLGQCGCYCSCLGKRASFTNVPPLSDACSAAPPFCTANTFYALANDIKIGIFTGSLETAKYESLKKAFAAVNFKKIDIAEQKKILNAYGSTLDLIASSPTTEGVEAFKDASGLSLSAYIKVLSYSDDAHTYSAVGNIFARMNDAKASAAANILYIVNDKSLSAQDKKNLHVDVGALKQTINKAAALHESETQ